MIAFVVSVNGRQVCTLGLGTDGVLSAHVMWSGQPGEENNLHLHYGGLDRQTNEHLRWPGPPEIQVGDTVAIELIDTDSPDPPISRKTPAQLREEEEAFLAEMRAERKAQLAAEGISAEAIDAASPPFQRRVPIDPDHELPPLRAPWE